MTTTMTMTTPVRHRFCSACGTPYEQTDSYPRRCHACGDAMWANPIPVAVALVPIEKDGRTGLLVIRRGIEPGHGKLALVGGFVEEHESWQAAAAREVVEETGVTVDAASIRLFDAMSSAPRPNRLLIFATTDPIASDRLPPFQPGPEGLSRGIIFGPGGLEHVFAFPLHIDAARRWFADRWNASPHDHEEC